MSNPMVLVRCAAFECGWTWHASEDTAPLASEALCSWCWRNHRKLVSPSQRRHGKWIRTSRSRSLSRSLSRPRTTAHGIQNQREAVGENSQRGCRICRVAESKELTLLTLHFCDEFDLGRLLSVCRRSRVVALEDLLWQPHVAQRSPALAAAGQGNCRELLVHLEKKSPRRSIGDFTFCVDLEVSPDSTFVFAAAQPLDVDEEGEVRKTILRNLHPLRAPLAVGRKRDPDLSVTLRVLDRRRRVCMTGRRIHTSHNGPRQRGFSEFHISEPYDGKCGRDIVDVTTASGAASSDSVCQDVVVVVVGVRTTAAQELECSLLAYTCKYQKPSTEHIGNGVGNLHWDDVLCPLPMYSCSQASSVINGLLQQKTC